MASNVAVLLFSFSTILFSIASFQTVGSDSFEHSILLLVIAGLSWSAGSVVGYFVPAMRESASKKAVTIRWSAVALMALSILTAPWVGAGSLGFVVGVVAMFCSGLLLPATIGLKSDEIESAREAYAKSLIGGALASAVSAALLAWRGTGPLFPLAAAALFLAPILEPALFFAEQNFKRRWAAVPLAVLAIAAAFIVPGPSGISVEEVTVAEPYGATAAYEFRDGRKLDVYVLGTGAVHHASRLNADTIQKSVRTLTATELQVGAEAPSVNHPEISVQGGSARRRLAAESRRFDLIQILLPTAVPESHPRLGASAEGTVTVEALRLYFDRLKDEGMLQVIGRSSGADGQAVLSTIAEAWKKSARRELDLHAVAATSEGGKTLETVIVRMKPFLREERDKLGGILKVGKADSGLNWMLVSDASGEVLTDDRPFVGMVSAASTEARVVMWAAILAVLGLIGWVAMQERRKGLASRWQTASVATYFGGLGLSFAFFQAYFVLRAIRGWGMPSIAGPLVLAAIFVSLAAGATMFAGHPRRRFGVRIQPLANFVFAVIFTYLGSALFEPLVASGSEWLSAFVGMSVLIPFGLLGGAFLPNALEEASEKLAPRVLSLLWALYVAGISLGIYGAVSIGLENGLDGVFLAGLFCFAWVAIFSGLVRPWNVRKANI